MSSSIGDINQRWSLSRAVDALGVAARQAGRPGWIWIAGLFYPILVIPGFGFEQFVAGPEFLFEEAGNLAHRTKIDTGWLVMLLFLPLLARLWVGLARTCAPSTWAEEGQGGPPPLRAVWRAGNNLTLSTCGLFLQVFLLSVGAIVLLGFLPAAAFVLLVSEVSEVFGLLIVVLFPLVAFLLFYLVLLNLMFQIALHSLAQNRRGAASALMHAWRIARDDPWATARAALVDFVLYLTVKLIAVIVSLLLIASCIGIPAAVLVVPVLASGFLGVTRACYWARAYRALGGLSPDDRIPGLGEAAAPGTP